jgi:hypothetical protein
MLAQTELNPAQTREERGEPWYFRVSSAPFLGITEELLAGYDRDVYAIPTPT